MKELSIAEKAKRYDEALKFSTIYHKQGDEDMKTMMETCFPELKELEDERIRKALISVLKSDFENDTTIFGISIGQIIAWLERQGEQNKQIFWEKCNHCVYFDGYDICLHKKNFGSVTNESKEYCKNNKLYSEKQGEQKPLYIRFGDIPNNEQSKIYNGENEIGVENGVSVYPAFINGDNIILGLTLPITKTTLYTQQHLLEYDTRPCYLVSGDYVGNGTDGEPLIKNISIIKKLDNYRIKEQKPKVGDWVVCNNNPHSIFQVIERSWPNAKYRNIKGTEIFLNVETLDKQYHLWAIQDSKAGDVLAIDNMIFIYENTLASHIVSYCKLINDIFEPFNDARTCCEGNPYVHPATKEQRDLLFQKMKEAGYEWDVEKKELKKIEQKPAENKELTEFDKAVGVSIGTWDPKTPEQIQSVKAVSKKLLKLAKKQINDEQKPAGSEEDEIKLNDAIDACKAKYGNMSYTADWLLSIKDRVVPQQQEWSEEEKGNADIIVSRLEVDIDYWESRSKRRVDEDKRVINWLKSLRLQSHWKPSDEQITWLYRAADEASKDSRMKQILNGLLSDLKKLREE